MREYVESSAVKAARDAVGLTQKQAGDVLGYAEKTWQAYELGTRRMSQIVFEAWRGRVEKYRATVKETQDPSRISTQNKSRRKNNGFGLIEVVLGMMLMAVMFTAMARTSKWVANDMAATRIYNAYTNLDDALWRYLGENWRSLVANKPVEGVANAWAPTPDELKKTGYLDGMARTRLSDIGQLTYTLTKQPEGCAQEKGECNIVYLIKAGGGVRNDSVAADVLQRLGPSGLIVDPRDVNTARSWNSDIVMEAPMKVKNALFVQRIFMSSIQSQAILLNGQNHLTGDWNVGDHKLTGIGLLSTRKFVFTSQVVEGTPCTNDPGYVMLALSTDRILQICRNGAWVHANEEKTIIVDTVIHRSSSGGSSGSGSGEGGYRGTDGNLYSSKDAVPGTDAPCTSCSREIGRTKENGGGSDATPTPTDETTPTDNTSPGTGENNSPSNGG